MILALIRGLRAEYINAFGDGQNIRFFCARTEYVFYRICRHYTMLNIKFSIINLGFLLKYKACLSSIYFDISEQNDHLFNNRADCKSSYGCVGTYPVHCS